MQTISGLTLKNTTVMLDGKHFIDCTMTDCTLEYGGEAVILEATTFSGCRFLFLEDAGRTVAFLQTFGITLDLQGTTLETSSGVH